jgi:hypothetical protein
LTLTANFIRQKLGTIRMKSHLRRKILESGLFCEKWYARQYPDVGKTRLNPKDHFLKYGLVLGRNPSEKFDS